MVEHAIRHLGRPPYLIKYNDIYFVVFCSSRPFIWHPYRRGWDEKRNPPFWTCKNIETTLCSFTIKFSYITSSDFAGKHVTSNFKTDAILDSTWHHTIIFYSSSSFIWYQERGGCEEERYPPSCNGGHFELATILRAYYGMRHLVMAAVSILRTCHIGWQQNFLHYAKQFCRKTCAISKRTPYWIQRDVISLTAFCLSSPFIWYLY